MQNSDDISSNPDLNLLSQSIEVSSKVMDKINQLGLAPHANRSLKDIDTDL